MPASANSSARPIGKFQAVQQNLAVMAGQVAAAGAAADLGVEALSIDDPAKQEFLIAIAKTRVGDAATLASEIAHQVHGAIGFTKEYSLATQHAPAVVVARRVRRRYRMGGQGRCVCVCRRRRCAVADADRWVIVEFMSGDNGEMHNDLVHSPIHLPPRWRLRCGRLAASVSRYRR
jgi:alkylation response protein AidB-like acyl-CoA dehydrogenase